MRASALRSLRTRLLVWLLGGVLLLGVAGGLFVYRNALAEADAFFDYHLKETALFLRDQPVEYQFPTPIPPNDVAYDFVVQFWTIDGRRIYIGPEQVVLPNSITLGYSTVNTSAGQSLDTLDVAAEFASTDIPYVLQENLVIHDDLGFVNFGGGTRQRRPAPSCRRAPPRRRSPSGRALLSAHQPSWDLRD